MTAPEWSPPRVAALIDEAARPIPLLWPLSTAIAANPLWDVRDRPWAGAVGLAGELFGASGYPSQELMIEAYRAGRITDADLAAADRLLLEVRPEGPSEGLSGPAEGLAGSWARLSAAEAHDRLHGTDLAARTDREVAKWAAAHLGGRAEPAGTRPATSAEGFYPVWVRAAAADRTARRLGLPASLAGSSALATVAAALAELGVTSEDAALVELTGQLARLPGFAAYAKWRSRWAAPDRNDPGFDLTDLLAVRLAYDTAALAAARAAARAASAGLPAAAPRHPAPPHAAGSGADRFDPLLWLTAYELHYRDRLLATLGQPRPRPTASAPAAAQLVFCIDVRSEGLRRHLEAVGAYETFGFAGFFGVPARVARTGSDDPLDLCPVLIRPTVSIPEEPDRPAALDTDRDLTAAGRSLVAARKGPVASFALAEAAGYALGPLAALRSGAPRAFQALRRFLHARAVVSGDPVFVLDGPDAPGDDEQALYAETALRSMGLTDGFAPLVVFCGHGSTTENNPYGSALDCGACGAARGATSARIAAAICNRPPVRALLAERGVTIPDTTVFVAAEHDTATDAVTVFDPGRDVTSDVRRRLGRLEADLARAGAALAAERAASLPGAPDALGGGRGRSHVATRSADWAQVQPEWGLARCAAFIVADRSLTLGRDLDRRTFLHSYDRDGDADGAVLETVLTGPMVVAQWISAAYYFATVDPDVYGAGDKVAHNVVAGVAVYQGAGGDLRVGLPRQAVFDGDRPYHEPMRLLVVVDAPRSRIDSVVDRNQVLGELIGGQWIHLVARDQDGFWLRRPGSGWQRWQPDADAGDGGGEGPVADSDAGGGEGPPGQAHPPQKEVITRG
ncbi:MAG: DUF2309 domain-containing protein [Acidobacteriota bacterium]|nr:DUF2309 domain-containing protein [Acidobacteriota bacterium]